MYTQNAFLGATKLIGSLELLPWLNPMWFWTNLRVHLWEEQQTTSKKAVLHLLLTHWD
nr:hypothetical protein Iba_chr04aCG4240 [Ipomoea batatas]